MPNVTNNNGGIQPQRPLTGPVNNGTPPGTMPPPPPPAPYRADQNQVAAGPARDPQIVAAISVYALQLQSQNPVDVSSAIATLERFGPAYRQDVISAVSAQLYPGQQPMRQLVLIDALVRQNATEALDKMLPLINETNPEVRTAASKAFAQLKGIPASAVPAAAGAMNAPGQIPGAVPGANGAMPAGMNPAAYGAPGGVPPEVAHLVDRLKRSDTMGGAAYELATLPTAQVVAVANAIFRDGSIENERVYDLMSAVLAKRIREPGVLDSMRVLLDRPDINSRFMYAAKARAATALIHYGTPQDLPKILKLLPVDYYAPAEMKKVLIDQIVAKPELLNNPVTTDVMIAVLMNTGSPQAMIPAGHALSQIKSAKARDALGESPLLSDKVYGADRQLWVMDWLSHHPAPYSGRTIENLRRLAKSKDKKVVEKATELLKKAGQKP